MLKAIKTPFGARVLTNVLNNFSLSNYPLSVKGEEKEQGAM